MKTKIIKTMSLTFIFLFVPAFISSPADAEENTAGDAMEIAVEAYIYFYPLVSMDVTRRVSTNIPAGVKPGLGPANMFHHTASFPAADFKTVVRPNFDTLYSIAWLDLTREPMIISAPDTNGRYYLLAMLDMWTDVFAAPGKRTTGTKAGNFAVVPQCWKGNLPAGVERIESPTSYVWIIGRTQTNGPRDYDNVHKVQEGFKVTAMSQWGGKPSAGEFKADPAVDMETPPLVQVDTMPAESYFKYAAEIMKVNGPHVTDWSVITQMKKIGIEPGKGFDISKLEPVVRQALEKAPAQARRLMKSKMPTLGRTINGWSINTDTVGVYGDCYLKRAIIAQLGLGANQPEDAVYPMNIADAEGIPCSGNSKYVLHFSKTELPPVNAFWSLTMYDENGFQAANPINRFAIGDRDDLKCNSDGSLDIYIQNENPGDEKESNWLPCPKGPLGMTMRLYWPKSEVLDGRWNPPAVQKVKN